MDSTRFPHSHSSSRVNPESISNQDTLAELRQFNLSSQATPVLTAAGPSQSPAQVQVSPLKTNHSPFQDYFVKMRDERSD